MLGNALGLVAATVVAALVAVAVALLVRRRRRRLRARLFLERHHPRVLSTPKTRKVLFIHPTTPLDGGAVFQAPRVFTPALTLPHLAALTPPHWETQLCYETSEPIPWETDAQIVALSCMGHSLWRARELALEFRRRGKHVALGGTMASLIPDFVQKDCDTLFVGDADRSWPRFLADFEAGQPHPRYEAEGPRELSDLPVPRYDLLLEKAAFGGIIPVQIARGCCNRCRFCTVHALSGGAYSPRPIEQILRDLRSVTDLGSRLFFFLDDNLAADPAFARELFRAVKPLGIRWASQSTLDLLGHEGLLDEAVASGCVTLCFGLETLSQPSLANVGKGFARTADYADQLRRIHAAGLMETAEFIIGLDHDTPQSLDALAEFIIANAIPVVRAYLLAPIPGTPVWQDFQRAGRLLSDDHSRIGGANVGFRPVHFTPEELLAAYWRLMDRLYSWPAILRRVLGRPQRSLLDTVMVLGANWGYRRHVRSRVVPGQC